MKKQTRSILQELNNLAITSDKDRLIESTANNIINSSINLINLINSEYDATTCLLYTSPSPRDATLSRMPSSA